MSFAALACDWLLANDPALSRFRMGARVTLTVVGSVGCLVFIHLAGVALPAIAYGLAIILSIEGGVAVRDRLPSEQLLTRFMGSAASLACVAVAALLENYRPVSDFVFLLVILAATVGRVYGPRGFAIGMFAFTSYFMGAYLKPQLSDLPLAAMGPAVALVIGHVVRTYFLPDDWRRDLLRSLTAVKVRVDDILMRLAVLAGSGRSQASDRRELRQLEERLKDVVLMAEGFLPRPAGGAIASADEPVAALAMKIFDMHLAAESAIVLSLEAPPPFALVHAVVEGERAIAEKIAASPAAGTDERVEESARAVLWLDSARTDLADALAEACSDHFRAIDQNVVGQPAAKPDFSFGNPLMRAAVQITTASSVAMLFGLMLSRDRWFWAVLTAFLIFTNTKSRGDTALRALQRSVGTLLGIGSGLVLATLLAGHPEISVPVGVLGIFLGFYFLQMSYAVMSFFISIVLCLIYGLMGQLTFDLLLLRVEETLIGAVVGAAVAFLVFPAPTRSTLDEAISRWFGVLRDLLSGVKDGKSSYELIELSRQLDAAYREITVAARPLGSSWSVVTRPGRVRQTLAIFLGATYWARIFARNAIQTGEKSDGQIIASLESTLRDMEAISSRGSDCFFVERSSVRTDGRHLPIFKQGSRVGVEMIGTMLGRLYPDQVLPSGRVTGIPASK